MVLKLKFPEPGEEWELRKQTDGDGAENLVHLRASPRTEGIDEAWTEKGTPTFQTG